MCATIFYNKMEFLNGSSEPNVCVYQSITKKLLNCGVRLRAPICLLVTYARTHMLVRLFSSFSAHSHTVRIRIHRTGFGRCMFFSNQCVTMKSIGLSRFTYANATYRNGRRTSTDARTTLARSCNYTSHIYLYGMFRLPRIIIGLSFHTILM